MNNEPILMPFQDLPFNGDTFVQEEFLKLKDKFDINSVVETGSCLYSTSKWLGENFERVCTIEINPDFAKHGIHKVTNMLNVTPFLGSSVEYLNNTLLPLTSIPVFSKDNIIYFLDAHWNDDCPLLQELEAISKINEQRKFVCDLHKLQFQQPIIVIHDFKVPNESQLGYDSIHGQPFEFDWIKPYIQDIYGVDGYDYYYNSNETSTEIKRGVIYITPKQIKNEQLD